MLFSKYLVEPFLTPLRSKNFWGWILTKRPQQQGVIQAGCGGGAGPLLLTANSSLRPQILTSPGHTTPSPSYSNGNQKDNSLLECYQAKSNHESTSNYSMKQLLNAEWPYHFLLCVHNKQKPWSHTTYHFVSSLHIFDRELRFARGLSCYLKQRR